MPNSARARVILWEYTAEQTLTHPLLGVGVESTPTLRKQQKAAGQREHPEGFVYSRTIGHHAHDIFLQTWYELGAVGALLLAITGAAVVILIFLLPASAQPFAGGAFAAFALVGAFAWGMWQSWFMCAVGLLPLYLRIAAVAAVVDVNAVRPMRAVNDDAAGVEDALSAHLAGHDLVEIRLADDDIGPEVASQAADGSRGFRGVLRRAGACERKAQNGGGQ